MIVIGCDLGNKSRNSLVVMDENRKVLEYSRIKYDSSSTTVLQHRRNICNCIREYIEKYKPDYILFEKINLFVGSHVSKLNNIVSLAFLQCTIINEFSESIGISEINVQSWKALVLGNRNATKDDSVRFVRERYPEINLDILEKHKTVPDKTIVDNDTADACCIAIAALMKGEEWLKNNSVNFT